MLFRILLVAILVYFILRAVSRLIAAMRQDRGDGGGKFPRNGRRGGRRAGPPDDRRATRDERKEDIEDARWKDL